MKIAAVIPALNEGRNIGNVVRGVLPYVSGAIVVDDGSIDDTAQVASEAGATVLRHETNRGKGAALKTGFRYLVDHGYEGAVTIDADGQHDATEIPLFVSAAQEGYDMVIGNRMSNVSTMPFVRRFANHTSSFLISLFLGQMIRDSQNGFRYYRLSSVTALPLKASKYDLETEVIFKAARAGQRIGWVPTRTIYRTEARSKFNSVTDTLRFIGALVRYGLLRR